VTSVISTAVGRLRGKTADSNEALLIDAYRATQYKQKARRRSTYDELVSTGSFGLIESGPAIAKVSIT
jgi:hypothetical protein